MTSPHSKVLRSAGRLVRPVPIASLVVFTALALSACGGDDSSDTVVSPAAQNQVPLSATASVQAYESFAIAQAPTETAEPLQLDNVVRPPTSETAEPIALP